MCAVCKTTEIIAIATAAVRDAVNGPEFIRRVQEKDRDRLHGRIGPRRGAPHGVSSGLEHSKAFGCSSTSAAAAPGSSWAIPGLREPRFAQARLRAPDQPVL
ncbi:MAG: hypothetical protein ACLSAH_08780 [Bilophila wadsworthia]